MRFLALLIVLAAPAALGARDGLDCDEMTLAEEARDEAAKDQELVGAPSFAEVIVPCAVIESGLLGPACEDAPFYVVNQNGTLLCRVELAVFTNGTSAPIVEQAPAVPASQQGFSVVVAIAPAAPASPPAPPLAVDVTTAVEVHGLGPADAHVFERLRPS